MKCVLQFSCHIRINAIGTHSCQIVLSVM
uniref:Uncharacterized protein n=1 Tax=Anguilla anguilla TaxID=7936 RepID=A0A0E9RQR5_ANGAN